MRVQTQWQRCAMSGRLVSLNHQALESALRMMRIRPKEWAGIYEDICEMEIAALNELVRD